MSKVFRLKALMNDATQWGLYWFAFDSIVHFGWPVRCEGLTVEEINNAGYTVEDSWLVEEE